MEFGIKEMNKMEIYYNNRLSLPEQVENNRENIEILFGSLQNGEIVKSNEILTKNNWNPVEARWKQTVSIPRVTENTFTVTVCDAMSEAVLDAFSDIIQSNSIENGVEFFAKSKPDVDIIITVWYNIVDDN